MPSWFFLSGRLMVVLRSGGPAGSSLCPLLDLAADPARFSVQDCDADRPRTLPLLGGALGDIAFGVGRDDVHALRSGVAAVGVSPLWFTLRPPSLLIMFNAVSSKSTPWRGVGLQPTSATMLAE